MPPASASPAPNNCTRVAGVFVAGEVAACRADGIVALHISTPAGRFIFRVQEKMFVRACRGPVDHNGNPFRTLEEIKALGRGEDEQLQADAAAVPPAPTPAPEPAPTLASFQQGWEFLIANLDWNIADASARFGFDQAKFSTWITYHHNGELRERRRAAGLSLMPRSRYAAATSGRQPVAKPAGHLL